MSCTRSCQPWLLRKRDFSLTFLTLKRISCGLIVVFGLASQGCQGFGLRTHDDMAFLNEEDDDWYYPNQHQSKVPRPSLADLGLKAGKDGRNRISQGVTSIKSGFGTQGKPNEEPYSANSDAPGREPGVVAYGTDASKAKKDEIAADAIILDTNQQEVDVEGVLESLPPAYRDVLRKQLALVQSSTSKTRPEEAIAKSNPLDKPSDTDEQAMVNATSSRANNAPIVDSNESITSLDSSSKKGVSIRMNDTDPGPSASEPILAEAASAESKVVHASTTNLDLTPSGVALASATSPSILPSILPSNVSWKQGVGQAIELLEKQIKETPSSDENLLLSQELTLRMLYVSQRRLDDALRPIPLLSGNESEQQFVHHQMLALYEASNPDAMPVRSRHWSLVMNSQREATNHLAAASNLEVKSLAFCTEVERYGVVTKFPKTQFQEDQEVLLYCEIENVAAEKVRNGFETQLQGSYEIMDSQGRKVADQLLPMEPELCQNHRRDYFIVYKIYMPPQIATGNYQLRLTIEDMKARKYGQSQLDFSIKK